MVDSRVTYRKNTGLAGGDGGYDVLIEGEKIGTVERYYPTWEREPYRGAPWVLARGTCKRAEWRARNVNGRDVATRQLRDWAVEALIRHSEETSA